MSPERDEPAADAAAPRPLDGPRPVARRVRFGDFELDVESGELWSDGERRPLRPLATKALLLLVTHKDRLVTREELRRHLWGDAAVEWETGLHQVVRQLRRALGDDAGAGGFIVTVPRRGYAWAAPVSPAPPTPVPVDRAPASPAPASQAPRLGDPPGWRLRGAGLFLVGAASLPVAFLVACLLAALAR